MEREEVSLFWCTQRFWETRMELGLGLEGDFMQSYLELEILYEV